MSVVTTTVGAQWCFADHGTDFSGGAAKTSLEKASPDNDVQMDLTSLANDTGWESAKADLGANRAPRHEVAAVIEGGTFTTGERIDFFWAPSSVATAANGNPQQIDGVSAAAPSGIGLLDELLATCIFIGSLVVENTASGIQIGPVGVLVSPTRYGMLIVVNRATGAFGADAAEHHVVFNEIIDDVT